MKMKLKKSALTLVVLMLTTLVFFSFAPGGTNYFEVSKNLDIFATLFREVNTYYVDDVDAGKLIKKAIDEMLESLDPYTNYISEAEAEDFRFQMTGQYGGIGSLVGTRNNEVIITEPYEGYPAQKADLRAGDVVLEIDGKPIKTKVTGEISKLLKGQSGTQVKLLIKRQGEGELTKVITREEIQLKNVPYYGMLNNETGYIRLASFTQQAGKEVHDAVVELKKNAGLKNLILDVRGNPGGLLHESINIVNVFVPQGVEVVSTKGKVQEWDKSYKTLNQPVDTEIPLVVLTSRSSASASEIVSGSIQDLDRGVVIGQKTFGKGLVQSTRPLTYNTQLKVTTAKYYTPSGRCIQALDYSHRNADGSVGSLPDSLKRAFKTKAGRVVYDGGGIDPDVATVLPTYSKVAEALLNNFVIFDFANAYKNKYPNVASLKELEITDALFNEFKQFASKANFEYQTETDKQLADLKAKAEKEKYFDLIKTDFEKMKQNLNRDKMADIELNKQEIKQLLALEIAERYYYQRASYLLAMQYDAEVKEAINLFADQAKYKKVLTKN